MSEWKEGQRGWMVPFDVRRGDAACEVVVVVGKIGRKWAQLEPSWRGRFDVTTGLMDGGVYASPGRVYASREEHEAMVRRQQTWSAIGSTLRHQYSVPDHLSDDDLQQLAAMLRVSLEGLDGKTPPAQRRG